MNNREWLYSLDVADLADWFDAEHVETENAALDGDTDALERKSADLINEYYKPMVSELQAKIAELERKLRISWEYECKLQAERDELQERLNRTTAAMNRAAGKWARANEQCNEYREKFGKCLDYADAIHALMDDEGMA